MLYANDKQNQIMEPEKNYFKINDLIYFVIQLHVYLQNSNGRNKC
ncbi:hypothetical protein pb186bvf_005466 [Paramecium bursaria]